MHFACACKHWMGFQNKSLFFKKAAESGFFFSQTHRIDFYSTSKELQLGRGQTAWKSLRIYLLAIKFRQTPVYPGRIMHKPDFLPSKIKQIQLRFLQRRIHLPSRPLRFYGWRQDIKSQVIAHPLFEVIAWKLNLQYYQLWQQFLTNVQ